MKKLGVLVGLSLYALYGQCANCSIAGPAVLPSGFDPDTIILEVGQDTEVVIQFTLPDEANATAFGSTFTIYPNYAIYVDSLRMASGTQYVVVKGTTNTPVSYSNGAFQFDQAPRYKEVQSGVYAWVVVYRNLSDQEYNTQFGTPPGGVSPARGCVRACLRGINPTPSGDADSLYIRLRAFVDPNTINLFPLGGTDANDKDTTNLKPTLGTNNNLYLDTTLYYRPVIVQSVAGSVVQSAVSGKVEVSPNPAWGVAKVRFALNYPVATSVRAMDGSGRVVYERMLGELAVGEHIEELRLPSGVYIVELTAGRESYKTRLVVLE